MPPSGVDRFIIMAGEDVQVTHAVIHGDGGPVPNNWSPTDIQAIPPGTVHTEHTGNPAIQPMETHISCALDYDVAGHPVTLHTDFGIDISGSHPGFWIGHVAVGVFSTPNGPDPAEPFGMVELVNNGVHLQVPLIKGWHIT